MKRIQMKRALSLCLALALSLTLASCNSTTSSGSSSSSAGDGSAAGGAAALLSMENRPDVPAEIPEGLDIDWNKQYRFDEIEGFLEAMAEQYPDVTELYSIGRTHQERDLWCLEITNEATPKEGKTGIGVLANIHGGERESAASGLYTAWWLTLCSSDEYVKSLLDNYVVYVVPVINPDGYEQSFVTALQGHLPQPRLVPPFQTGFAPSYPPVLKVI